jgi:YhcH/YjgK/YiaL family protein
MILDTLEHADLYTALNPGLQAGFDFLRRADLAELPDGKYEIDGDRVFAVPAHVDARREEDGQLEGHKKYIDIQYIISGNESIGWKDADGLPVSVEYDEEKDLMFFEGKSDSVFRFPPGSFAIFFPGDAHLPLIGSGEIHKVVVKVAV